MHLNAGMAAASHQVFAQDVKHVVQRAPERHECAVHVALANRKRGIDREPTNRLRRTDLNAGFRAVGAGIRDEATIRVADRKAPRRDEPPQYRIEDPTHPTSSGRQKGRRSMGDHHRCVKNLCVEFVY